MSLGAEKSALQERLESIAAIQEGLQDIAAGRTRPAREALEELAVKHTHLPPSQSKN